jgi:hypothetical protein
MEDSGKNSKRYAGADRPVQSKAALASAKRAARIELQRIFEEEAKEWASDQRYSLARPATASRS